MAERKATKPRKGAAGLVDLDEATIAQITAAEFGKAEGEADSAEVERTARREIAQKADLDPSSLCGSWALYHSPGGSDTDSKTVQGLIVAEPQAGIYLVQLYNVIDDEPTEQKIIDLATLGKRDDEGGEWAFYDDRDSVRKAFRRLIR